VKVLNFGVKEFVKVSGQIFLNLGLQHLQVKSLLGWSCGCVCIQSCGCFCGVGSPGLLVSVGGGTVTGSWFLEGWEVLFIEGIGWMFVMVFHCKFQEFVIVFGCSSVVGNAVHQFFYILFGGSGSNVNVICASGMGCSGCG